jgi:hypothetical protein
MRRNGDLVGLHIKRRGNIPALCDMSLDVAVRLIRQLALTTHCRLDLIHSGNWGWRIARDSHSVGIRAQIQ